MKRQRVEDIAKEKERYQMASQKASEQLKQLYDKALQEVGEANAAVFEVHMMMLEDDDYVSSIVNMIETQEVNAEYAVAVTVIILQKCFRKWMMNILRQERLTLRILPSV